MRILDDFFFLGSISLRTIENMKTDVLNFIDNEANKPNTVKEESAAMVFLNRQQVSDKTVADAIEALIGIYVQVCSVLGHLNENNFGFL